jgi:hypothetical protein
LAAGKAATWDLLRAVPRADWWVVAKADGWADRMADGTAVGLAERLVAVKAAM